MENRRKECFKQGTLSEKRFASYLEGKGIEYETVVGTSADTKGKIDFIVKGWTVNVKAPTRSGPPGLCAEWRAVNGSSGWLHKVDYIVKFIDDKVFYKIPVARLKEHVIATRGIPPSKCPQTGAGRSNGAWYARQNWEGKDRTNEACVMIPPEEIEALPFAIISSL